MYPRPTLGQYSTRVLADGAIGYWRLGETSGTTFADSSGNGLTGTIAGSFTLAQGGAIAHDSDRALRFANGTIAVPYNAIFDFALGSFTIEAWVNPTTQTGGTRWIIGKGVIANNGWGVFISGNGFLTFYARSPSGAEFNLGPALQLGVWTHCVIVINRVDNMVYAYHNGIKVGQASLGSLGSFSGNHALAISRVPSGSTETMIGVLDEVALYPTALSTYQVMNHYKEGVSTPRAPIGQYSSVILADSPSAYLRLGETAGTFADSSGNGVVGTSNGVLSRGALGALPGDSDLAVSLSGTAPNNIILGDVFDFPGNTVFSVETWVKFNSFAAPQAIFGKTSGGASGYQFNTDATTGVLRCTRYDSGATAATSLANKLIAGRWHYIVMTYNGSLTSFYVDAVLVGTGTQANTLNGNAVDCTIGAISSGNPLNGNMDEFAVYPTVLTPGQIVRHYRAGLALPRMVRAS